mgnify:CR=1 FL=1
MKINQHKYVAIITARKYSVEIDSKFDLEFAKILINLKSI